MVAAPPANFEALEAQARTLLAVFIAAGYEAVAPDIIQPAGVFLDVVGEALRGRTYVFTDLNGEELCLRPDLTVPTCRLYLQRHPARRSRGLLQLQRAGLPLSTGECRRRAPARVPPGRHRGLRRQGRRRGRRAHAGADAARRCSRRACRDGSCASATSRCSTRCCGRRRHARALAPPPAPPVLAPRGLPRRAEAAVDQSGALGRCVSARAHRSARSRGYRAGAESLVAEHLEQGRHRARSACARRPRSPRGCSPSPPTPRRRRCKPETAALIEAYVKTQAAPAPQATSALRKLVGKASAGIRRGARCLRAALHAAGGERHRHDRGASSPPSSAATSATTPASCSR